MYIHSRRSFLKAGGAAVATVACAKEVFASEKRLPTGLQLYSVRSLLPNDFDGTLHRVRDDGYTVVEAAGYYNHSATDFRRSIEEAGLRCVSTHYNLTQLETEFDQWIDYGKALDLEYIICANTGRTRRDPTATGPLTLDDWRWFAGEFNQIGAKVKAAGMQFAVHNHRPEFATLDGVLVYDELLKRTNPETVAFEMDCGWVWAAGYNPIDYLSNTPERFPLLHIKDMSARAAAGTVHTPVLGKGKIDYKPILRAARRTKYYFVEQEQFDMDQIEELRLDAEYMKKITA
jgi:sugar phosphate isomerase/epimerase